MLSKGHELQPLLVSDYIDLAEAAWRYRHDSAAASIRAADLSPEERLRAIDQLDQLRGTRGPLIYWAWTYVGAAAIVRRSLLRGKYPDPDGIIDSYTADEIVNAARKLIGLEDTPVVEREEESDPT